MVERFFNWLMRNKMLIFLALVASMISLSGFNLWASGYDEFAPVTDLGQNYEIGRASCRERV